jgi:hypothetical protein
MSSTECLNAHFRHVHARIDAGELISLNDACHCPEQFTGESPNSLGTDLHEQPRSGADVAIGRRLMRTIPPHQLNYQPIFTLELPAKMDAFPTVACVRPAGPHEEIHTAELDEIAGSIIVFSSLSRRIELRCKLVKIAMRDVQADFKPVLSTCIGFRSGSISD